MRTIALVSASLVMITLPVTDVDAASNRWCATTPKRSENCGFANTRSVPGLRAGARRLVPTKSVPWDGVWDQRHLVVRAAAPEPGRVLEVRTRFPCGSAQRGITRSQAEKDMALRKFIIERDIPRSAPSSANSFAEQQQSRMGYCASLVLTSSGLNPMSPTTKRSASISPKMRISFASTRRSAVFRQRRSLRCAR
jgi:hypothetical protein